MDVFVSCVEGITRRFSGFFMEVLDPLCHITCIHRGEYNRLKNFVQWGSYPKMN